MAEQQSSQPRGSLAPKRLMLLVTIVQKGKGTFFSDYLQTFETNLQICVVGTGTARADLVEFLGLRTTSAASSSASCARTSSTRSSRRWRSISIP